MRPPAHQNQTRPLTPSVCLRALTVSMTVLAGCTSAWRQPCCLPSSSFRALRSPQWTTQTSDGSRLQLSTEPGSRTGAVRLDYSIPASGGYAQILAPCKIRPSRRVPFGFRLKAESGGSHLEVKFEDRDGTVFGHRIELKSSADGWVHIALYPDNFEYWWGGRDDQLGRPVRLFFAVAGSGQGTLRLDSIGFGPTGLPQTFAPAGPQLDPDRHLPGCGFRQRRAQRLLPEDPMVLEWLKREQDVSSPEQQLLRTMEGSLSHTFNNALVAMAFILKDERPRAERILDFYAAATDPNVTEPRRQSFFLNGEARGFYQAVQLRATPSTPAYVEPGGSDRWVGDMAWLLIACKHYERRYDDTRYQRVATLLEQLLVSFYKDAEDGPGGYVQHGWRNGDSKLHEDHGHPEANIDCYAAFRLCGRTDLARNISRWLSRTLRGTKLPLDLYSWRVLAHGRKGARRLDIPEFDLRYRKTLTVNGRRTCGFCDQPDANINNIWLDGTGHMACAYIVLGDKRRGYFYANQMDSFIFEKDIGGQPVHVLPYAANRSGTLSWVDPECGFVSAGAWYLFAKNGFNPLTLEQVTTAGER